MYIHVPLNVYTCLSGCLSVSLSINVCVPLNVGMCSYPVCLCASPYLSVSFFMSVIVLLNVDLCPYPCLSVSFSLSVCVPVPPPVFSWSQKAGMQAMECAALKERMTLRTQTFTVL